MEAHHGGGLPHLCSSSSRSSGSDVPAGPSRLGESCGVGVAGGLEVGELPIEVMGDAAHADDAVVDQEVRGTPVTVERHSYAAAVRDYEALELAYVGPVDVPVHGDR